MELPDYIKNRFWKDYLPAGMTLEIDLPDDLTLGDVFRMGSEKFGEKINMVYGEKEFTFKELYDLTIRFSNALLKLGVNQGEIVALWLPNCPQFAISYFGALSIGATITAISPLYVAREMAYQIKDSGAKYLIIIDRFIGQYYKAEKELNLEKEIRKTKKKKK